jgi:hypothetical protein
MDLTPKLATLLEHVLVVAIIVPIVLMGCALAIAFDIHSARVEFAAANAEWRRESFRRVDQMLWKADTALEIGGAMRLDLGTMLTKLRAQVKQSSDESAKATTVQAKAATVAVTQALETTREAIQAVAGDAPVTTAAPAADKPITVNVPPPVIVNTPKPVEVAPKSEEKTEEKHRRRWYTYLWHWW